MHTTTDTRAMDYFRAAYLATRLSSATDTDSIQDALEELDRMDCLPYRFKAWQIDHEGTPLLGQLTAHYVMNEEATATDLILTLMAEGIDDQLAIEIGGALDSAVHTFKF